MILTEQDQRSAVISVTDYILGMPGDLFRKITNKIIQLQISPYLKNIQNIQ